MDQKNMIDLAIETKQIRSYKLISRGHFAATIEIDNKEKGEKTAALLMTKKESESRKFEFPKLQSQYTVQALEYEYLSRCQTYLIHTDTGESLRDKIKDKKFQKSLDAIDLICNWIRDASLGLKKIHSLGFLHLNIQSTTIMITTDNRVKIGAFDFSRHSSTVNESTEYGSVSHYNPPERFVRNCGATDGVKFDVWCLAILTVESLTDNYIERKSTKVTTWPELYPVIHKILQVHKFKKEVKKTFPKAPKGKQLEHILRLMTHILKFEPEERPNMNEFSILLMELSFLKYIDMRLVEEDVWLKKVPLVEVEHKMRIMALDQFLKMGEEKKPRVASKMKMVEFQEELYDQILGRESEPTERVFDSHHLLRRTVGNKEQINLPVDSKVKRKDKMIITPIDGALRKSFSKDISIQVKEDLLSNKREITPTDRMTGDFISDNLNHRSKDTEAVPFEHKHVQFNEDSSLGKLRSKSESIETAKPDKNENATENNDLIKNTEEEIVFSKQENDDFLQSNNLEPDKITNMVHIDEKPDDVVTCETQTHLHQNNPGKTARRNHSAKSILLKVVNWACDEAFYTGYMNHGSFISKVSKTLTG